MMNSLNGEQDSKRKDNPSKPKSTQFQGKRIKLVTILVVRDVVTIEENIGMVPTTASTVVKKVTSPENALTSMEKEVDSYRSGTRRKHSCHASRS